MLKRVCVGLFLMVAGCSETHGDSGHDAGTPDSADPNACEYNGNTYETGDVFCAIDGCNECSCNPNLDEPEVHVGCTNVACAGDGGVDGGTVGSCGGGMWHLTPIETDPVSLRLNGDGTFRWVMDGCDFGSQSEGIYRRKWNGALRFLPTSGETTFDWVDPDTGKIVMKSGLEAQIDRDTGVIEVSFESGTQRWEEGGLCPVCGELGPSETVACDNFRDE